MQVSYSIRKQRHLRILPDQLLLSYPDFLIKFQKCRRVESELTILIPLSFGYEEKNNHQDHRSCVCYDAFFIERAKFWCKRRSYQAWSKPGQYHTRTTGDDERIRCKENSINRRS